MFAASFTTSAQLKVLLLPLAKILDFIVVNWKGKAAVGRG